MVATLQSWMRGEWLRGTQVQHWLRMVAEDLPDTQHTIRRREERKLKADAFARVERLEKQLARARRVTGKVRKTGRKTGRKTVRRSGGEARRTCGCGCG